ncbi:MAG TPA: hypothetical protein VGE74_12375 [Gemmata sp.]
MAEAAVAQAPKTASLVRSPSGLQINTVADLKAVAEMLYNGGLTPPNIDNPNKVAAVIMCGMEVGLAPIQALGSIMLTGGRMSIYGDAGIALVRASGQLEAIEEWVEGEGENRTAHCKGKRRGEPERHYTFSMADANRGRLIERARGKDGKGWGPWLATPDRMMMYRARGYFLRDHFPDILRGLITFEEAQDGSVTETEVKVVSVNGVPVDPPATAPGAPQLPPVREAVAPDQHGPGRDGRPSDAQPVTAPVATVPAAPDTAPVTDAQKEEFFQLRALVWAAKGARDDASQRAAWTEALAPFGVASVGQLTAATAATVIAELKKTHCPF